MCSSCIHFTARLASARPARQCAGCGRVARLASTTQCSACWQRDPNRLGVWLDGLRGRVELPGWFDEFIGFVTARYASPTAIDILRGVAAEITTGRPSTSRAVMERCGRLTRPGAVLEAFLVDTRRAFAADDSAARAERRRRSRIDATPTRWRGEVEAFAQGWIANRDRAARRGSRQISDRRIEHGLSVLRDFARHGAARRLDGWASVSTSDIEAFLSPVPQTRTTQIDLLRRFFGWAGRHRKVVSDPTRPLRPQRRFTHTTPPIPDDTIRGLFHRWSNPDADVFEATIGMLTLVHGASVAELRGLTTTGIDTARRSVRLGRRPGPITLDPFTWTAVERALDLHRETVGDLNEHLFTTARTRMRPGPPPQNRISAFLTVARLGVNARALRSMHLARMAGELDVVTAAAAHGLTHKAILYYCDDGLDPVRERSTTTATRQR